MLLLTVPRAQKPFWSVVLRNALVSAVTKETFDQINHFLDQTGDAEEAVPFGDLAQAAMEAKLELKLRGVSEV